MSSLRRNVLFSYVSQIYMAVIGIVMVPLYVSHLGVEAYGLVGFFAMLQAWFQLIDVGLTQTLSRETARFRGGASDARHLRGLFKLLELFFVVVAIAGIFLFWTGASSIANSWLNVRELSLESVETVISIIGIVIGGRWLAGLYRGVLNGYEKFAWLSVFNILIATARFVMVLPYLIFVNNSIVAFFEYQCVIALLEMIVLLLKSYQTLPKDFRSGFSFELGPVKQSIGFSLSIAFTSSVWIMLTQMDKLVLSKLLSLKEYAYFMLAVVVAGGVSLLNGPVSNALLPRLSRLQAEGQQDELLRTYRIATQFIAVLTGCAALTLIFFAPVVLEVWTGDQKIAKESADILRLYAAGNGLLAVSAFPYYLQYAKGELKLHVIGNVLFLVFLIPSLIFCTTRFGALGAAWSWLTSNVLYFAIWVPYVHNHLLKGLHSQWLRSDVLIIWIGVALACIPISMNFPLHAGRIEKSLLLLVIVVILLSIGTSLSKHMRQRLLRLFVNSKPSS